MQTPETKKPKIAVLHEAFLYRGGAERLVTLMGQALDADIISGFFSEGSFDPRELGFKGQIISLGKSVFAKGYRHLTLKYRFRYKTKMLADYDIVILSGNCTDAIPSIPKTTKIFFYCHTPPRYIFDLREKYLQKIPKFLHRFLTPILDYQGKKYIEQLSRINTIFTNSKNTHDRLLHFCQKESTILYPPTDTKRFKPTSPQPSPKGEGVQVPFLFSEGEGARGGGGSYFLSCARLSPPKRVDLVVRAFQALPEKNLVFTYGANDPEKERILIMCEGYTNIFPIPAPKDDEFIALVAGAIANIYIPVDEDFGMTPVESMSCGVPIIGVREGGLLETVIEGKTGVLVKSEKGKVKSSETENQECLVQELIQVIRDIPESEWKSMKDACLIRASNFSLDSFAENLKKYIF